MATARKPALAWHRIDEGETKPGVGRSVSQSSHIILAFHRRSSTQFFAGHQHATGEGKTTIATTCAIALAHSASESCAWMSDLRSLRCTGSSVCGKTLAWSTTHRSPGLHTVVRPWDAMASISCSGGPIPPSIGTSLVAKHGNNSFRAGTIPVCYSRFRAMLALADSRILPACKRVFGGEERDDSSRNR